MPDAVKRYFPSIQRQNEYGPIAEMFEGSYENSDEGGYVLYADYDTLTRELAEARARITELTKQRDTFMRGLDADAEECAELHAEIDVLKAKVERLSAPVTDEEWIFHSRSRHHGVGSHPYQLTARQMLDELILARRAQGGTK